MTEAAVAQKQVTDQLGLLKRIRSILGVRARSEAEVVRLVERGLATDAVEGLRRSGLTDAEIYSLVVPRRTLTHRRARRQALNRDESDRAVRLARMTALAEQVFGRADLAWRWLRAEKRQFDGRTPLELMATEAGARLVEEFLYRVDEGMAA
jgi:putative toxin-antitoxin system antitoxin component (TIGR02293 family)